MAEQDTLNKNRTAADATARASVRCILFDVGGVLSVDMIDTKLRDLSVRYGAKVLEATGGLRERADRGDIDDDEFWRSVIRAAGGTPTPEDVDIAPYLVEVPGTLELARRLRARGHRIGILSNDSQQMSRARRNKHGFDALFDPIIISSSIGATKPGAAIYAHAVKLLELRAEQILFIDNAPANVEGARAAGLQAFLFENAPQLEAELRRLALL